MIPASFPSCLAPLRLGALLLLLLGPATACGGDEDGGAGAGDGGPAVGVHPRFDPTADPMDFGAIPWPDDLYLGEDGRIAVGQLPGEDATPVPEYVESLRRGLGHLDGFGAVTPVFFTFDGGIDPASLPPGPSDSIQDHASAFLMDVDPGSPVAFTRVPIRMDWEGSLRQLALRPDDGHPLAEGRRYAAVLTSDVRSSDGRPLVADPDFAAVRDAATRPEDPVLAEAHDHYSPVLSSLESHGIARDQVVALAVFRVQTVTRDLRDARTRIWEGDAPTLTVTEVVPAGAPLDARLGAPVAEVPGLDVEGGVAHGSIGWMIHGSYGSPWLLSEMADVHGRFEREADGRLRVKRNVQVPFTLWLPNTGELSALRVAIFQHGLGGDRSQALSVADSLVGAGYAVIAIDAPYHGLRSPRFDPDRSNRFTGEEAPDGFGDVSGSLAVIDFVGIEDSRGDLSSFHPVYLRDALRQTVVDVLALVRLLRSSESWRPLREADEGLASTAFADGSLALVGVSLGGVIGTMITAMEPEVGASVLAVTGGHITQLVANSPPFNQGYIPLLWPLIGLDPDDIDYEGYHPVFQPEVAIWQTLLDRGDSINYARALKARQVDVLMFMAKHDETLHNQNTEALARAIGASMLGDEPVYTDIRTAVPPVRDNDSVEGEMLTRAVYVHEPATHGLLTNRRGVHQYAHPVWPPFERVSEVTVDNPVDASVGQVLHFLESWRTGSAEIAAPPPD